MCNTIYNKQSKLVCARLLLAECMRARVNRHTDKHTYNQLIGSKVHDIITNSLGIIGA